ncbi:putative AbiEii toxin of type IV toxin-antitoxin system [Collimonas sp. PA-H2]|uniref:TrlF family AAA-like ATPase n=1 Tax=Collimonas sp. PA-H2 TaxID=1881062 RepID=UPI000BF8F012|nr:AAA family ATPase [Collimonas sp. PA-H2]PFH10934.1 putative AbiEii toxin of type IV toxin-antitoxin system [Collimonas sp. PA-H2]
MADDLLPPLNSGSRWQRWEPHVHAPGTIFNDQFKGDWNSYFDVLEAASPSIQALGVTDYYGLDTYRAVVAAKATGRLSRCDLIFPNVELRLDVGTAKSWVNAHLLVSPEDSAHLEELSRFLARLTFQAHNDSFCCQPSDLIRLGHKSSSDIIDERAALRQGSEQFKVSFDQLRTQYRNSAWAKANILIAVSGAQGDGTSGLREGADRTLRQEVERFAHIIFTSNSAQREFWLGRKNLSPEDIRQHYDGLKPCLHGSDGHSVAKTGSPDGDRYSWVKGEAIFDTLRQVCIDPAGRAYVGTEPPPAATSSEVIAKVSIIGAPWAQIPKLALNPGLVAIIGARGSGKTALADIIAAGCDAHGHSMPKQAFLIRAREYLGGTSVRLDWQAGGSKTRMLDGSDSAPSDNYPRARYLSQQFVEELCSSDGITDSLLSEVERVIFDAHPVSERDGAIDFADLREMHSTRHRKGREREEQSLATLSERISGEIEKTKLVDGYKTQIQEKKELIARMTTDRANLVPKGSEERVTQLEALTKAAERVRGFVRHYKSQEQQLILMQDEIGNVRSSRAPEDLRDAQERHISSGIKDDDWLAFLMDYKGDVDGVLTRGLIDARRNSSGWNGTPLVGAIDPILPLIAENTDLETQTLSTLEAEIGRIQKLVSIDKDTTQRFEILSKKIVAETDLLKRLSEKLFDCEGAKARLNCLLEEREASYIRVFEAVIAEQEVLAKLYAPIKSRLETTEGTLRKLSFSVTRTANVDTWSEQGEALLDLRRQGPFRGRGTLCEAAKKSLKTPWETGDAKAVAEAMNAFRVEHQDALLQHSPIPRSEQTEYRSWSKRFAQWLYSTDHISVRYSVNYDAIDIRKLSPGTRGIVLLLLYLSLDDADGRPLIIDQPEENLDPKSIYDDLVGLFLAAKTKRQVIIVTHNANLVINTDADQIIIANAGPHSSGGLPPITYTSGGLENEEIRKSVCDILEGGEKAFRERTRRLRIRLDR